MSVFEMSFPDIVAGAPFRRKVGSDSRCRGWTRPAVGHAVSEHRQPDLDVEAGPDVDSTELFERRRSWKRGGPATANWRTFSALVSCRA
ncbi:hypothetical protein [Pseudonocardia acidicola]|uniref:Uncharacterized protein n=1 Tax=Pseudonocardia acidicola TaxID=2724939 RepID=A0ABX1SNK4_9PSEU|nr:hypothetical protein [Pseudonocardia acidicola]NMI01714.1 hypothetical protein [Pseudonocardia acidicola]